MYESLLTIAVVHLFAAAAPGPNNLLMIRTAVASRAAGLATAAGLGLGSATWATAALAGLNAVLAGFPWLDAALKAAGGAFLIYLGWRMWRGARAGSADRPIEPAALARGPWQSFAIGALTNLTNPKSLAYFASVFAVLVSRDLPLAAQAAAVGIVTAISLLWYVTVALALSTGPALALYTRARLWIDRAAAALMLGFGLRLLATLR